MERGTDQARKEAKEQVPGDRIKDAPAMARELRWRVRLASGYESDDDTRTRRKAKADTVNGSSRKRKRADGDDDDDLTRPFMHFKPKAWNAITVKPIEKDKKVVKAVKPDPSSESMNGWSSWDVAENVEGDPATVECRKDVIIKVRRTGKKLERQRVERVLEEWTWDTPADPSAEATVPAPAPDPAPAPAAENKVPELMDPAPAPEDVKMEVNGDGDGSAA